MTDTATITPEAQAHAEAHHLVNEWAKKLDNARKRAETRTGSDILDDPGKAADLARSRAQASEEVQVCTEGLKAARGRLDAAARAVVGREADDLQDAVDEARAALDAHNDTTARMLAELTGHTGTDWARLGWRGVWTPEHVTPAAAPLHEALTALQARQDALRAAAAGDDPRTHLPVDQLPASLLPGGVWVHPGIVDDMDAQRARQAEEAAWAAVVASNQTRADEASRALGVDAPAALDNGQWLAEAEANADSWTERASRRSSRPWPIGAWEHFRTLAAVCGSHGADAALTQWEATRAA